MVVPCPSCAARYRLSPEKIQGRGAKITCPKCSHVFVVFAEGSGAGEGGAGSENPQPPTTPVPSAAGSAGARGKDHATTTGAFNAVGVEAPPSSAGTGSIKVVAPGPRGKRSRPDTGQMDALRTDSGEGRGDAASSASVPTTPVGSKDDEPKSASALDFREVGIQTWKVKVAIGLIYDFSDIATLKKYLADKKVTPKDLLSPNGKEWTRIEEIPDLDQHFVRVWKEAKAAMASGAVPPPKPKKFPSEALSSSAIPAAATGNLSTSSIDVPGSTGSARTVGAVGGDRGKAPPKSRASAKKEKAEENESRGGLWLAVLAVGFIAIGAWFALRPSGGREPAAQRPPAGRRVDPPRGPSDQEKIERDLNRKLEEKIREAGAEPSAPEDDVDLVEKAELVPVRQIPTTAPPRIAQEVPRAVESAPTPEPTPPVVAVSAGTSKPGGARMYLDAGRKKLAANDFGSAEAMLKKAIAMEPDCKDCWESLAEAYQKHGNAEEATLAIEKARQLGTQNAGRP